VKITTSQTNISQNNPLEIIVPEDQDGWELSGSFTVDKEGLMDNLAIKPEMYYQTRGDLSDKVQLNKLRFS
jgi:hypothetical protein